MQKQKDLAVAFFRIGLFGFGGGPTMIPLVHKEVVDNYNWMSDDEFANVLAIGNTLPGPIATKMAGYIGYKVAGTLGCINAVLATIVPIIFVMIAGLSLLNEYRDMPWVAGMTQGVIPVVTWMMVKLTYDFLIKGYQSLGMVVMMLGVLVSTASITWFNIHPGLIVAGVIFAVLLTPCKGKNSTEPKLNTDDKES